METVKRAFQEMKKKGREFGSKPDEINAESLNILATIVEDTKRLNTLLNQPIEETERLETHIREGKERLQKGKKLDLLKFNSTLSKEMAIFNTSAPLNLEMLKGLQKDSILGYDKRDGLLRKYEVFLSFRGEDTRTSIISHLYASLRNNGITVFKDDNSLQKGDHISTSLLQAIEQSRISIIVLSKNYADSRWCLDELVKIMECRRTMQQIVLPVFYDVEPSEVRYQTGEFGKAYQSLLNRISNEENIASLKWRNALHEAAGLVGFVLVNTSDENNAINGIAEKVTHLLDKKDLFVADKPVGVNSRVQDVIGLLNIQQSNDVLLIGMWGMGGIGKTTIAKAIFNEISRNFEGRSFLAKVREVWQHPTGQVDLQEQLISDIFRGTTTKIKSIDSGKIILKDRLCHNRVLIVLDDVDELEQLDALCGNRDWFGKGSRIIITTRDI